MSPFLTAGWAQRSGVVAREEFRRAFETRWMFGFTLLLVALVLGLSYFGLSQSREVGFQGFDRVTMFPAPPAPFRRSAARQTHGRRAEPAAVRYARCVPRRG